MSTQGPVDPNNEKEGTGEQPPKKTVEELQAELLKKQQIADDKHNFALKTETENKDLKEKLKKFELEEEEKRKKELEAKGDYEKITGEAQAKAKGFEDSYLKSEAEKKTISDDFDALLKEREDEIISSIPENKRDFVNQMTSAYKGKEKIEKLKLFASEFKQSENFGGVPEKGKKKQEEIDALVDKFNKDPKTLSFSEKQKVLAHLQK